MIQSRSICIWTESHRSESYVSGSDPCYKYHILGSDFFLYNHISFKPSMSIGWKIKDLRKKMRREK